MDINDLTEFIPNDGPEYDPAIALHNFIVDAYRAEWALRSIEESLETFDPESIYEISWGRSGYKYWTRLQTRKTSSCYYAAGQDGSERRFRCAEVDVEEDHNNPDTIFRLGRCVYEDLLDYQASCIDMLEEIHRGILESQRWVSRNERRIAAGEFSIARSRKEPLSGEVNWMKEGF